MVNPQQNILLIICIAINLRLVLSIMSAEFMELNIIQHYVVPVLGDSLTLSLTVWPSGKDGCYLLGQVSLK